MKFKKLELEPQGSWIKRMIQSKHIQKTAFYMLLGAIGGFLFFYLTGEKSGADLVFNEMFHNILIGAFFGWFITNNPCARNRC